ncbi:MAG: radical SAM protein [Ruminococcaceae bacterium]|nr:radical SAM protein [Oscillospiraceae bacterium]
MRKYNLPVFIPHLGCPHDCAFCNQKKITGVESDVTPESVEKKITDFLKTTEKESEIEIAFFGGSFTGIDISLQEEFLLIADKFRDRVCGIRLSTRPDYISDEILDLLVKYGVTEIELGAQSSDDEVLKINRRGHTFSDTVKASGMIKERGIKLGLQMMLGMAGSNEEKDIKTAEDIIALKPDSTRIYPTLVLSGTALEKMDYEPYSLEEAAEIASRVIELFRENNVKILRIGLHESEELRSGSVVKGPYHPAFGEIAESLIWRRKIEKMIEKGGFDGTVECKPSEVSKIIGHKKMNKLYFYNKHNIMIKPIVKGDNNG